MPQYESIFIVRPSLTDEETEKVVEKVKGVLQRTGASVVKQENWGKKRLAYEVRRERKGTYIYFNFTSPGESVAELERSYRIEDAVIKFMTIKLEDEGASRPAAEAQEPSGDGV